MKNNNLNLETVTQKYKQKNMFATYLIVIGLLLQLSIFFYFGFKDFAPPNTAIKINNVKISNETFETVKKNLNFNNKIKDEDKNIATYLYIINNYILAEKAKREGFTINEKEIKTYSDFQNFANIIALSEKYQNEILKEPLISDKEINEYYNKNINKFIKKSNFSCIPIKSKKPIPQNAKLKTINNNEIINLTIEELNFYQIFIPKESTFYLLEKDKTNYKYLYIIEGNIEYYSLQEVKDNIIKNITYDKTIGYLNDILKQEKLGYNIQYYYKEKSKNK